MNCLRLSAFNLSRFQFSKQLVATGWRQPLCRSFSEQSSPSGEWLLTDILRKRFPDANIKVQDISGGCGAMYDIYVESASFKGLNTVKQHRLVNEALKDQIKEMHGLRLQTSAKST